MDLLSSPESEAFYARLPSRRIIGYWVYPDPVIAQARL
jgi:hypothetical protein